MAEAKSTIVSFLLDQTGSMAPWQADVIGGFNQFVADQRAQAGECRMILTLFNTMGIETARYDSLADVPEMTTDNYRPNSGTPLLDAIGKTIAATKEAKHKGEQVLFVIYTDGEENASREFTKPAVKELIEKRQAKGWQFVFIGADLDAYQEAGSLGILAASTMVASGSQSSGSLRAVSASTLAYRQGEANYQSALKDEEKRQKAKS